MSSHPQNAVLRPRPIPHLRWWIGMLLFASTIINYLDRQTLSLLAPYLKIQYHWTNTDYASIIIAFRIAYSIGYTALGRFVDKVGTRIGLSITVAWYSTVSVLTALARGLASFAGFRFLLGVGESANWPAATKAVSEWFPEKERALATALFDSGSSIGSAIAPFVVLGIYYRWGWRPAFMVPGLLGFLWLLAWRALYHSPQRHPRLSEAELALIVAGQPDRDRPVHAPATPWLDLLKLPQTWGIIVAKTFTDPVWFFVTDWFPIYLVSKGIELKSSLVAIWIPFMAADLGNFFAGAVSGYLIRRGWTVGRARKALVVFGAIGVMMLIPTVLTRSLYAISFLFAFATFSYSVFSTIAIVLPADVFRNESVASVSGFGGTGAGIGTILAFLAIGRFTDAHVAAGTHSFDPIMIVAGMVPFVGMLLVLMLVRNNRATEEGRVNRI